MALTSRFATDFTPVGPRLLHWGAGRQCAVVQKPLNPRRKVGGEKSKVSAAYAQRLTFGLTAFEVQQRSESLLNLDQFLLSPHNLPHVLVRFRSLLAQAV